MAVTTEDWDIASVMKTFREVLDSIPRHGRADDEIDQVVTSLKDEVRERTKQLRIAKYRYEIKCAQDTIAHLEDAISNLNGPGGGDDE